jgi:hypothetical protein
VTAFGAFHLSCPGGAAYFQGGTRGRLEGLSDMAGTHPSSGGPMGPRGPRCSFCGRAGTEAGPLVEGQGPPGTVAAFICHECVELARTIFAQLQQRPPGDTLHDNG